MFFFGQLDPGDIMEVLTTARLVWLSRNDYVFGRGLTLPCKVIAAVKNSLDCFAQSHLPESGSSHLTHVPVISWSKPTEGKWKINWDAAINKETLKMGMGIVIRDDAGNVVTVKAKYLPYLINPQTAEAMAGWYAIQFGREMGGRFIILEGDSLEVVTALRRKVSANQVCGQLLDDIKTFFSHFTSVDVRHVRRDANKAAHVLPSVQFLNC